MRLSSLLLKKPLHTQRQQRPTTTGCRTQSSHCKFSSKNIRANQEAVTPVLW